MEWFEIVKELKTKTDMTNEQFAKASGVPLGTVNKLLAGQTSSPKLSTLQAFASTLGVTVADLIGEGLEPDQRSLLNKYASLDDTGKNAVRLVVATHLKRMDDLKKRAGVVELDTVREIKLYDVPVSAGHGSFLDSSSSTVIRLDSGELADRADYAVKVSGDSMEPKFNNGDIVIVESCSDIPVGKIGIFLVNGESYIKKFAGNRLLSVNPAYSDIILTADSRCLGLVLGKLKRSAL